MNFPPAAVRDSYRAVISDSEKDKFPSVLVYVDMVPPWDPSSLFIFYPNRCIKSYSCDICIAAGKSSVKSGEKKRSACFSVNPSSLELDPSSMTCSFETICPALKDIVAKPNKCTGLIIPWNFTCGEWCSLSFKSLTTVLFNREKLHIPFDKLWFLKWTQSNSNQIQPLFIRIISTVNYLIVYQINSFSQTFLQVLNHLWLINDILRSTWLRSTSSG